MRLKIRCDKECEKFCKTFWEVNNASVKFWTRPKTKNFSKFPVTSNLATYTCKSRDKFFEPS